MGIVQDAHLPAAVTYSSVSCNRSDGSDQSTEPDRKFHARTAVTTCRGGTLQEFRNMSMSAMSLYRLTAPTGFLVMLFVVVIVP